MRQTLVLLVVGLSRNLLGAATPNLSKLASQGSQRDLVSVVPAVTCSAQATLITGSLPRDHGIVGNGWYFRDLSEVWFWRQSARLYQGERLWEAASKRDSAFTCAKMFWWYNMYDTATWAVTPRPMYPADGRKLPDIWADPPELRDELNERLGPFPLFNFWGPRADISSSRWIAESALYVYETRQPTLTLVYLPHLDYCLQKFGPGDPEIQRHLREIDDVAGLLIERAKRDGTRILVVSEYGIVDVEGVVHINKALREAGLIRVRSELGKELLDAGMSDAFAVADHQIAHVYIKDPARIDEVRSLLERLDGIESVHHDKRDLGLDHPRSGELVAIANANRWFSYYYWLDDARAPDFARCVDIHRKPGYDPVELFLDPQIAVPWAKLGLKIARSKLGFRTLMDVIPLDASLVRGSHGRLTDDPGAGPLVISSEPELMPDRLHATDFKRLVLSHVFE